MIDLKSLASDRYRITLDESSKDDTSHENRPWYYRIPCKYGFISVYGADMLAAYARGRIMPGKLAAMDGTRIHQRGDDEIRVLFSPDRLDAIADLLGARRRRHLSPKNRAEAIARLQRSRPNPSREGSPAAQSDPQAPD